MAKRFKVFPISTPVKDNPQSFTTEREIKKVISEKVQEPPRDSLAKVPKYDGKQGEFLQQLEGRFLEVANLEGDLSGIHTIEDMQVETNKEKSDTHGEVFTPLWLVDDMLDNIKNKDWKRSDLTTFDLCSGYGQFTIRLLRRRYFLLGEVLDIAKVLSEYHLFAEIQPSSCFRLLYIFGSGIRLLIGDVFKMVELPDSAEHGIWVYARGEWRDRTDWVLRKFDKYISGSGTISERADAFEKKFNSMVNLCEKRRDK